MAWIYIYPYPWRKEEALVIKWRAVSSPACLAHRGIYRFIRRGDNAARLGTSPARSRLEFLLGTKRPVSHSRTAATRFVELAAGREGECYGKKEARRDASVKARLAPVINYQPVHAPVVFFNFSPRFSNLFHPTPTISFSIARFIILHTRRFEINISACICICSLCKKQKTYLIDRHNRSYLQLVSTRLSALHRSISLSMVQKKKKRRKRKKGKTRIFFEYLKKWYIFLPPVITLHRI